MKNEKKPGLDWNREFLEFINTDPISPPNGLSQKVKTSISRDLKPPLWKIFGKLFIFQVAWGTLTLFICPQFEIGFTRHDHLSALIPHGNGFGFLFACGMFFLSGGAMLAPFVMKPEEIRSLGTSVLVYFPTAALAAVLLFHSAGAHVSLPLGLPWLMGGISGSIIGFEISRHFRQALR